MQSTAKVFMRLDCIASPMQRPARGGPFSPGGWTSGVVLGLQHLAATVVARGADVVAKVGLARGGLDRNAGRGHGVVRAMHAALGRRLLVLLDGHEGSWIRVTRQELTGGLKLGVPRGPL